MMVEPICYNIDCCSDTCECRLGQDLWLSHEVCLF